jgi:hypothetical protein
MMEALAMNQSGIATRTSTRTFCPGSAGAIKSFSLPGHLSGHNVRKGWPLMKPDWSPVVLSGPALRQNVALTEPCSHESHQIPRHFGGIREPGHTISTHRRNVSKASTYPLNVSVLDPGLGIPAPLSELPTESRQKCRDSASESRHVSRQSVASPKPGFSESRQISRHLGRIRERTGPHSHFPAIWQDRWQDTRAGKEART